MMARDEAGKLATRSLSRRPAETVLLIIGIALGVGTTAGGISMVAHLNREGDELLRSTQYREIVVSTRENAEDMEVPAYRYESEASVTLTGDDLSAREAAPDVEFAYTMALRRIRISNFQVEGRFASRAPGAGSGAALPAPAPAPRSSAEATPPAGEGERAASSAPPGDTDGTYPSRAGAESTSSGIEGESGNGDDTAEQSRAEGESGKPLVRGGGDERAVGGFSFEIPEYSSTAPVLEEIEAVRVTPEFFSAYGIQPAQGSLFTQQEIDARRPVAVVGAELADELFEDGLALGREILFGRSMYEIIGIAGETGTEYDDSAFYPSYTTAGTGGVFAAMARAFGFDTTLRFMVSDPTRLDEAKAQLESHFDSQYGAGAVVVSTPGTETMATIDRNTRLVTIILFLAVTGLLIAAVNVSNILYSRAMRRRKSVGILKALGATKRAVFHLFFKEALTVGLVGGLLGIAVSIGFTRLLGEAYAADALVTLPMVSGAVGALMITLGLTVIPALQASSIPPAEALRYE